MTNILFNELQEELQKGASQKNHPFHVFTLGTVGLGSVARLRTIVLREFTEAQHIIFFTDFRSKKILHLKENNRVGMLFYHPEKRLQLKIEGLATIYSDPATKKEYWNEIDATGKKSYTTTEAPGSALNNPELIDYLGNDNHFCMVEITPFKIEYLKLEKPEHIRVRFSKQDDLWKSEYLVP